jgi:hypothetical protein
VSRAPSSTRGSADAAAVSLYDTADMSARIAAQARDARAAGERGALGGGDGVLDVAGGERGAVRERAEREQAERAEHRTGGGGGGGGWKCPDLERQTTAPTCRPRAWD